MGPQWGLHVYSMCTPLEYLRGPFRGLFGGLFGGLATPSVVLQWSIEVLFWSLLEVFWGSKKYNGGLYFLDLYGTSMGPPCVLHGCSMGTPKVYVKTALTLVVFIRLSWNFQWMVLTTFCNRFLRFWVHATDRNSENLMNPMSKFIKRKLDFKVFVGKVRESKKLRSKVLCILVDLNLIYV